MGNISRYPASWVREGDWKLIRLYNANNDQTDRFELYNLRADIGETRDLSLKQPERVKALSAKLERFVQDTRAFRRAGSRGVDTVAAEGKSEAVSQESRLRGPAGSTPNPKPVGTAAGNRWLRIPRSSHSSVADGT